MNVTRRRGDAPVSLGEVAGHGSGRISNRRAPWIPHRLRREENAWSGAPFGPGPCEIAVIGQGTWCIDEAHRPTAVAALRRGLDLGMTHIDTAEMYNDAEIVVGEAITGRRDEVFLVSKVLPSHASRAGSIAACVQSLARLRTDRLDGYLLHWPGPHPLEDTFAASSGFASRARSYPGG